MLIASFTMKLFACLTLVAVANGLDFGFVQHRYHIKIERAFVSYYNKDSIKSASLVAFKYNRTTFALNSSVIFLIDVRNKLEVTLQTYKFASNEYRLFPIRIGGFVCDIINANTGGMREMFDRCGNSGSCVYHKGIRYETCNIIPDETRFPPNIPKGKYLMKMYYTYASVNLYIQEFYSEVYYPEV